MPKFQVVIEIEKFYVEDEIYVLDEQLCEKEGILTLEDAIKFVQEHDDPWWLEPAFKAYESEELDRKLDLASTKQLK